MIDILIGNFDLIILFFLFFVYLLNSFYCIRKYLRKYYIIHTAVIFFYGVSYLTDLSINLYIVLYIFMYLILFLLALKEKFRRGDVAFSILIPAGMNIIFTYIIDHVLVYL